MQRGSAGFEVEQLRAEHRAIAFPQGARIEGLPFFRRQAFRQVAVAVPQQQGGIEKQEDEDRAPVQQLDDPAAHDGRDGRRDGKDHRHQRQQLCRRRPGVQVADDGAAYHHAGAGRDPLQYAEDPQVFDAVHRRAGQRGDAERGQREQDNVASAVGVGQRAMPQGHDAEGKHVGRQCLLHLDGAGIERGLDIGKGGQVSVD